jgi:hypothetical protein
VRYLEKQKKVEEKVFEAIDEIAEEFDIPVKEYPAVYWLGRDSDFECIGLSRRYKREFSDTKNNKAGIYFERPKAILLAKECASYIGEEATHFLHTSYSGISSKKKKSIDKVSTKIIVEMLGFFGSKLVNPARINPYRNSEDLLFGCPNKIAELKKRIIRIYGSSEEFLEDFLVHQQGYTLGESLFQGYWKGKISKKEIRDLFSNSFRISGSAAIKFFALRREFWPIDSLKTPNSLD